MSQKKKLKVKVVSASNLPSGKANYYCEVHAINQSGSRLGKAKTTGTAKSTNPSWNELLEFNVPSLGLKGICVRCWSKHTFRKDGFQGQLTIKFNTELLKSEEVIDDTFNLSKRGGKKTGAVGDIKLQIQYGDIANKKKAKPKKGKGKAKEKEVEGEKRDPRGGLVLSKHWYDTEVDKNEAYQVIEEDEMGGMLGEEEDQRRLGPCTAALQKVGNSQVTIKDLEVRTNSYGRTGKEWVRCNVMVNGGKWYFEATMVQQTSMQIGFCTASFDAAGKGDAWTYDVTNTTIYRGHTTSTGKSYGQYCRANEVIGCSLDVANKSICFYKNGQSLGEAFNDAAPLDEFERMTPVIGVGKGGQTVVRVNFGKDGFAYPLENKGFFGLHSPINESQMEKLVELYNKYKELGMDVSASCDMGDVIQGNGALQLQDDLGAVEEDDPLMLIIAWKLNCEETWIFAREEFVEGFALYGCWSLEQIREKATEWENDIKQDEHFKSFYHFVFDYLKGEGKKILLIEEAEVVWDMILKPRGWPLFDKWLEFLKKKEKKAISRDVWQQLFEFALAYKSDLSNYDEMAAWPLIFDEFVEWTKGGDETEEPEYTAY
eukprot:CAMPEP_0174252360 /NCGR_PEP_ID=MMETSP0439-20130205/1863_1 /TAXON_ID=0 /ORGANISM="Stereomyxa ramosa, Strain Chinc5" /LENGTH=598 /DNA_ID=CAMNT_0015332883 /DNA_START=29 /DNA_END=1825 /DNA_ORIENTATION=-